MKPKTEIPNEEMAIHHQNMMLLVLGRDLAIVHLRSLAMIEDTSIRAHQYLRRSHDYTLLYSSNYDVTTTHYDYVMPCESKKRPAEKTCDGNGTLHRFQPCNMANMCQYTQEYHKSAHSIQDSDSSAGRPFIPWELCSAEKLYKFHHHHGCALCGWYTARQRQVQLRSTG